VLAVRDADPNVLQRSRGDGCDSVIGRKVSALEIEAWPGRFQLIHGDAREFLPTIARGEAAMIMTDPPYGIRQNDIEGGGLASVLERAKGIMKVPPEDRPILNDGPEAFGLMSDLATEAARILLPGHVMCMCCIGGGGKSPAIIKWAEIIDGTPGLIFDNLVVWDKGPMGLGWHYRRSYEFVFVALRAGAKMVWNDESHRVENVIRPGDYGIRKIIPRANQHPTEKPWQLGAFFIRLHSSPGDVILDPFMGSGAFGEAALRMGRRYIGIELDDHWFESATRRLEQVAEKEK
jgi:site-specific DNA-methyltransferase (adenine-specific)